MKAETIAAKPAFRDAFRYRRCLIPASGFYEWDRNASPRQPYYFYPENEEFMAMAGVWEYWLHPSGSEILSASVVTMAADKTVSGIHHRMPLILTSRAWDAWLDTGKVTPDMKEFIPLSIPDGYLATRAVSRAVNKTATEGEELIQPRDPGLEGEPRRSSFSCLRNGGSSRPSFINLSPPRAGCRRSSVSGGKRRQRSSG